MKDILEKIENLEDITFDTQAEMANGEKAKVIFCKGWSTTKVTLKAIEAIIKNPIIKVIIGIIIKAGDAFEAKNCH